MRWFRFYDDAVNDPKIIKLSDDIFRAWVNLLCVASKHEGRLPAIDDVAIILRVKKPRAAAIIAELVSCGLLDKDETGFAPHNWNGRQYTSDSSASRVQKYREKRKEAGLPVLGDYSAFRPSLEARDGRECVYCLKDDVPLVVDHMHPVCLGGTDDLENLALACKACNSGKSGRTPEQAKMPVRVTSAKTSLERYRVRLKPVTVTVTPPETEADTEQKQKKKETREDALSYDFEFADFWNLWPNKVGKPAALKAFVAARKRAGLDAIVEGVFAYIRDKPPDRSWLNPATFLNQNRWEDQPAKVEHGRIQETNSLVSAARKHAEQGISFGPRPELPTLRSITGGADVRLLPQSGGDGPGDLCGGSGGGPERLSASCD